MADRFNPITDLQPVDPFNVPVEESSEEVESIRVKLIVTRNKTAELVNILKKKNISFSKDIDTIRELNRRLMRTIPRIPILRGEATTQTNRLEEVSMRRGQFDIDTTLIPKPDAKIPQRLLNFAVDIILTIYGGKIINLIFKRLGILKLIPPKLLEKIIKTKPNPNKPFEIPIFPNPNIKPPIKDPNVIPLFPNIFKPKPNAAKFNFSNLNIKNFSSKPNTIFNPNLFQVTQAEILKQQTSKLIKPIQFAMGNPNMPKSNLRILFRNAKMQLGNKKLDLERIRDSGTNFSSLELKNINDQIQVYNKALQQLDDMFQAAGLTPKRIDKLFSVEAAQKLWRNMDDATKAKFGTFKDYYNQLKKGSVPISSNPVNNTIARGLNRDTNTINNIYIVDDDFTIT